MPPPEKPIDWDRVDRFLEAGCNQGQIAAAMGVDRDTLHRRFMNKYGVSYTEYAAKRYHYGDALLLAAMMKKALAGNTMMLIWVAKVRLGQREPPPLPPTPPNDEKIDKLISALQAMNDPKPTFENVKSKTDTELSGSEQAV